MANRFEPAFHIGSEDEKGLHQRGEAGWPYSIYRQDDKIGGCDIVLCHGIQDLNDARYLLALCNGKSRAKIVSQNQMFAWA